MHKNLVVANVDGRLDRVLSTMLDKSRNQIEKLIKDNLVLVDGKLVNKPSHKILQGQEISYEFLSAPKKEPLDIDFDIEILYEDDDMLIVNKPSGLVVHPAPSVKTPTLVDWLMHKGISLSTISGEQRFGIVHRIDKETTGALVVAKNNESHTALSSQLQDKSMGRYYVAITDIPLKEPVRVSAPIARNPKNRLKMAIVQDGRDAMSDFIPLGIGTDNTGLTAAKLHTGRTHQIRVHLESIGRHILGDETYGYKGKKSRVYLHAYLLYLKHPVTNKEMHFVAPLFEDMNEYLAKYYNKGEIYEKLNNKNFYQRFDSDCFVA